MVKISGGLKNDQASRQGSCLGERGLGAVGGASALAFAVVLAGVLAAALTLTVVLALAGVLRKIGLVLGDENAGVNGGGGGVVGWRGLGIHADSGAAQKACERGGQSEGF